MTPEEIARRYGIRPGYRLVSYRQVGLPHWNMNLRCQVLNRTPLSPVDEFMLKCVDAELNTAEEVSDLLGLPEQVVVGSMAALVSGGSLSPVQPAGTNVTGFALTSKGRGELAEAVEESVQEVMLQVPFDGLLRRFVALPNTPRFEARELRELDILEMPAFPSDPPQVGPDAVRQVSEIVGRLDMSEEVRRDLLSVLGVEGRRRFFIRAVALVFEAIEHREILVDFVVDDRPSSEHAAAFDAAEGVRKMGIMNTLRESGLRQAAELIAHLLPALPDEGEVAALRHATDAFKSEVDLLEGQIAGVGEDIERERLSERLEDASSKLRSAESSLAALPVRSLEVYEHPPLLKDALDSSLERLLIISPWIRAGVVDQDFMRRLRGAVDRGVDVAIGYGSGEDAGGFDRDLQAERSLIELADAHSNLRVVKLGDTHAKVLVVDRRYVVVTSFNWLSFRGDPEKPFRDERGMLVTVPEEIDRVYESFSSRLFSARPPSST